MTGGGRVAHFNRYSAVCGLLAIALAGCSSQTLAQRQAEIDARRAAPTAVVMKQNGGSIQQNGLARSADGYPSFNGPLTAANSQIDDQQALDMRKKLTALGAQRKAGTITQAQYNAKLAEMQKLADSQKQTLQEIQN